jgi:hypothetical protein
MALIDYSKNYKQGHCALCNTYTEHLERHHISYKPEVTIDLCHQCHFLCHYFPNRLPHSYKVTLLKKTPYKNEAEEIARVYENNPIALAKLFAPSRREAIHRAQREEVARLKQEH